MKYHFCQLCPCQKCHEFSHHPCFSIFYNIKITRFSALTTPTTSATLTTPTTSATSTAPTTPATPITPTGGPR